MGENSYLHIVKQSIYLKTSQNHKFQVKYLQTITSKQIVIGKKIMFALSKITITYKEIYKFSDLLPLTCAMKCG